MNCQILNREVLNLNSLKSSSISICEKFGFADVGHDHFVVPDDVKDVSSYSILKLHAPEYLH